jgi:hypothetical protein
MVGLKNKAAREISDGLIPLNYLQFIPTATAAKREICC